MNGGQAIHSVLSKALAASSNVHLLGEALELSPATHGLLQQYPEQVHLLPAVDTALAGIAVGMAMGGATVVVELAGPHSLPAMVQQLIQETPQSGSEFTTSIILRVPWAPGESLPLGPYLGTDGLTIAVASSASEARDLLQSALESTGPTILIEPRWLLEHPVKEIEPLALNQAKITRNGTHCTLLCWGAGHRAAHQAADRLSTEGIEVEILDLRCLQPLDLSALSESVRRTGRPILVGNLPGMMDGLLTSAFLRLESPPVTCADELGSILSAVRQSVYY